MLLAIPKVALGRLYITESYRHWGPGCSPVKANSIMVEDPNSEVFSSHPDSFEGTTKSFYLIILLVSDPPALARLVQG